VGWAAGCGSALPSWITQRAFSAPPVVGRPARLERRRFAQSAPQSAPAALCGAPHAF